MVRDPVINAFAMPGGFIAINPGLFLATRNENELAGVMAHETAHVTQRHLVRGMIDQTHAGLVSTAAMLAAILLGRPRAAATPAPWRARFSRPKAPPFSIRSITRAARNSRPTGSGSAPWRAPATILSAMASVFEALERMARTEPDQAIEFLLDHPLSAERVAEARNRAEQIGRIYHDDSLGYLLIRERLRSLVQDPQLAREYYAQSD